MPEFAQVSIDIQCLLCDGRTHAPCGVLHSQWGHCLNPIEPQARFVGTEALTTQCCLHLL